MEGLTRCYTSLFGESGIYNGSAQGGISGFAESTESRKNYRRLYETSSNIFSNVVVTQKKSKS